LAGDAQHVLSELVSESLWDDLDASLLVLRGANLTPRL
jgi:hypothetical protein